MTRSIFFFLLGIGTCLLMGSVKQQPNFKDYIQQEITKGIKHIKDSVKIVVQVKDIQISKNKDTIIPAIKAQAAELEKTKQDNAYLRKQLAKYKELASIPLLIHDTTVYRKNIFGRKRLVKE